MRKPIRAIAALVAAALVLLALEGCGGSDGPPPGALERLGAPEGQLNLLALPGYVEDGSSDPVRDWVTPFERATGCRVTSTVASSPERVLALMRSGRYDGLSARGDVSLSLIASHLVDPINTGLVPNYDGLFPALKRVPSYTVGGDTYGIPTGRQPDFLVWRTDVVPMPHHEESSSNVVYDLALASRYAGGVTDRDNPMSIANAALYLREHDEQLGIDNVYELDEDQFNAAIDLLRQRRSDVGRYWEDPATEARDFADGATVVGPGVQSGIDRMLRDRVKIKAAIPKEETTGRADSWMIASRAQHPNCMYMWMNYMSGARANAMLAESTGQAPASEHGCDETSDIRFCDIYRAADESLFRQVHYWATPERDCGDDRGDACMDYADWLRGWREVTRP